MDSADPVVTVVLPTARRPESLARALHGLALQRDAPRFEVLVVDNDASPHAPPVLPPALSGRVVREPVPGAATARNRGIAETRTRLVALLDDDVVPAPDWLAALAAPVLAGRADLTGGRVLLDPQVARPRWLAPGLEGYLTALDLGPDERSLTAEESLLTASLLTRTEALRAAPFDPRLGPRGGTQLVGDDVQVVRDLRARGARAVWVPSATVVHELPTTRLRRSWVLRRAYLQGRSEWLLDAESLRRRRFGGAAVALSWSREQAGRRRREGWRRDVVFHAACDTARTAGSLVGAVRLATNRG